MTVQRSLRTCLLNSLGLAVIAGAPGLAQAQDLPQTTDFEIRRLNDMVDLQRQQLDQQQRALQQQRERIEALERAFLGVQSPRQAGYIPAVTAPAYPAEQRAAEAAAQTAQAGSEPVGESPNPDDALREIQDIAGLREVGGVLTPPGTLVFEPSIEFEQTSTNRFFFNGVQIADVVLIGDLEVSDADRDAITAVAAARTGITSRSEIDIRVPFVYRDDRVQQTNLTTSATTDSNLDNANLGDVEITGRYQFNSGADGWPIFIGNLRVKTPTGEGPFDIDRDPTTGIETELSTGSGFWAVEPSVTWIFPTDPAVFYGNIAYLWNFEEDVNENVAGTLIGDVDPGDIFGLSFGMGYSLNERTSFSVGYEHKFVFETDQEITTGTGTSTISSEDFDVGTLSFGFSYALTDRTSLNLTLQTGVTEDAPDVRMLLRVPIRFDIF